MKKLFFIVAAACLLTATSCVNNGKKSETAWREQLIEPLLDHRLAVGTRNTHDRDIV